MTSGIEILVVTCSVITAIGVVCGGWAFTIRYGNRLAFAERDSAEALTNTKAHAVQLALNTDHAATALALGEKHTQALSDTGARVTSMESTYRSIASSLEQLPLLRDDIGQLKTDVGVFASQMADTRNDVQECKTAITALSRSSRRSAPKKRQRK